MRNETVLPDINEDYEDAQIIAEAKRLRKKIMGGNKKYPEEMFYAFCVVLMGSSKQDYEEFIKDLDLSEKDKLLILKGILEKKVRSFWSDLENVVDFGGKILKEFDKAMAKKIKRKKK